MGKIRKPKYQLIEKKFLSLEEETRLLRSLENASPRDRLLVQVALKTGARANELLAVTRHDLKALNAEVFLYGLKGSMNRAIPIPRHLFGLLTQYVNDLDGNIDDPIFDISYPRLVQIWNYYAPNGKTFHCLRHTFAIRLFAKHQNLRLVQVALGHTNIQNTMIYADYHYNTEELRRYLVSPEEETSG